MGLSLAILAQLWHTAPMTDTRTITITGRGEAVRLSTGAEFMSWATVIVTEGTGPFIGMRIEVDDGQPVLAALHVLREAGAPPISATLLRELSIDVLVDEAVRALAGTLYWGGLNFGAPLPGVGSFRDEYDAAVELAARARSRRPMTDSLLRQVASIVRANPYEPRRSVAEQIPTSERTASRWIAAARERGLLEGDAK